MQEKVNFLQFHQLSSGALRLMLSLSQYSVYQYTRVRFNPKFDDIYRLSDKSAQEKIFLFFHQNICCGYSKELSQ